MAVLVARDVAAQLADGVTEPVAILEALAPRYRWLQLHDISRHVRALTTDTRDMAKRIVHARSAQTMLEVLEDGEPRDKIQVLAKWGPAVNDDAESRGGLTIIVGGNAQVQVNVGAPPQVVVGASLTKSE